MDLSTELGRAQAYANGGIEAELAGAVEKALQGYTTNRAIDAYEALDSIDLAFGLSNFQEMLDNYDQAVEEGERHTRRGETLRNSLLKLTEDVDARIEKVRLEIRGAMQILEGEP